MSNRLLLSLPLLWLTGCGSFDGPGSENDPATAPASLGVWEGGDTPVKLELGERSACALYDKGGVRCWGDNEYGQLGIKTNRFEEMSREGLPNRHALAMVPAFGKDVVDLGVGDRYACALVEAGDVYCWGYNWEGLFVIPGPEVTTTPIKIKGLGNVKKLSVGSGHQCALNTDDEFICWGSNTNGNIGNNEMTLVTAEDNNSPPILVPVLQDKTIVDMLAVPGQTFALTDEGTVYGWGFGYSSLFPTPIPGLHDGVTELASNGSTHICGLRDGAWWCYGDNTNFQLTTGDDTTRTFAVPLDTTGISGEIAQLSSSFGYTCARTTEGTVWCVGGVRNGALGSERSDATTPLFEQVSFPEEVVHLATHNGYACAIMASGQIGCWGNNQHFLLTDSSTAERFSTPVIIPVQPDPSDVGGPLPSEVFVESGDLTPTPLVKPNPLEGVPGGTVVEIESDFDHTCALYDTGGVRCWGAHRNLALGYDARGRDVRMARDVPGMRDATALSVGNGYNCVVKSPGQVSCWGRNNDTYLGRRAPLESAEALAVPGVPSGATRIASGVGTSCAYTEQGDELVCWGINRRGQAGTGQTDLMGALPGAVNIGGPIEQVEMGEFYTCARRKDGALECWGQLAIGELREEYTSPVLVDIAGTDSQWLTVGDAHGCVVDTRGVASCWGSKAPERDEAPGAGGFGPVTGLAGPVHRIYAGSAFTCAWLVDETVWCQGEPMGDPAGRGAELRAEDWVQIELPGAPEDLTAGSNHACALISGEVYCWGQNTFGQLGDANDISTRTPSLVQGL